MRRVYGLLLWLVPFLMAAGVYTVGDSNFQVNYQNGPLTGPLGAYDWQSRADCYYEDFNHSSGDSNMNFNETGELEDLGWDVFSIPAATAIGLLGVSGPYHSYMRVASGTTADQGGQAQYLDDDGATAFSIPQIISNGDWNDDTFFGVIMRIGLISEAANFNTGVFIGWADSADNAIIVPTTGEIATATTDSLIGWHFDPDGDQNSIAARGAVAVAASTNYFEEADQTWESSMGTYASYGLTQGNIVWKDFAFRIDFLDHSEATGNGTVKFWTPRDVPRQPTSTRNWGAPSRTVTDVTPTFSNLGVFTIETVSQSDDGVLFIDAMSVCKTDPAAFL